MSSSVPFTYDPTALDAASKALAAGAGTIDSTLAQLTGQLTPLHEGFKGQAATGFNELWEQWHQSGKKLLESLEGLSQLLHTASLNAAGAEAANVQIMGGR